MVWREVLSEGPLEENISSGSFWKARLAYICAAFNDTPEGYQERILDELPRLGEPYEEINLWFEYDLHCQVNMIGVLNYLKQRFDLSAPAVYLVCPADFPGKENFRGMGELNGEELEYLYDNIRVQLSGIDFIVAAEAWKVYVKQDEEKLKEYLDDNGFWGSLHCLKSALRAQLKRLHINENGLNQIEQELLNIYNAGFKDYSGIYEAFWKTGQIYGIGNMEIDIYLNKLKEKGLIDI